MIMEKRLIDANAISYCSYDLDNYHSFCAVEEDVIAEMPTIDAVEVVHGRWIIGTGENALVRGYRMCSVCGEIIKTQYSFYGMFNYCHNCGAKMDGDDQ